jgi:hypothetical protein
MSASRAAAATSKSPDDSARLSQQGQGTLSVPAAIGAGLAWLCRRTLLLFGLTIASSMLYRALQTPASPAELPAVRTLHPETSISGLLLLEAKP